MGRGGCCGLGRRWGPRRSGRLRPRSGAPLSGVDRRPDRVHEDGRPLSARVLLADASGHGRALLDRERFLRTPDRGCCVRRRRVGCCTSTGGPAMLARAYAGGGSRRTRGWIAGARGATPRHDGWERRPVGPGALGLRVSDRDRCRTHHRRPPDGLGALAAGSSPDRADRGHDGTGAGLIPQRRTRSHPAATVGPGRASSAGDRGVLPDRGDDAGLGHDHVRSRRDRHAHVALAMPGTAYLAVTRVSITNATPKRGNRPSSADPAVGR